MWRRHRPAEQVVSRSHVSKLGQRSHVFDRLAERLYPITPELRHLVEGGVRAPSGGDWAVAVTQVQRAGGSLQVRKVGMTVEGHRSVRRNRARDGKGLPQPIEEASPDDTVAVCRVRDPNAIVERTALAPPGTVHAPPVGGMYGNQLRRELPLVRTLVRTACRHEQEDQRRTCSNSHASSMPEGRSVREIQPRLAGLHSGQVDQLRLRRAIASSSRSAL